jgi:toxin YoeB
MSRILFTDNGWNDYLYWQATDKATLKRINVLLNDLGRNGDNGLGKPELLRGDLSGCRSRRIDKKNRLVYRLLAGSVVEVDSCRFHYDDK